MVVVGVNLNGGDVATGLVALGPSLVVVVT